MTLASFFIITFGIIILTHNGTIKKNPPGMHCYKDILKQKDLCRPTCRKRGFFSFHGMKKCVKWLNCDQIKNETNTVQYFAHGFFKNISWERWRGYDLARSMQLSEDRFLKDENFQNNIEMLKFLSPSQYIIQLVGLCGRTEILTEYHPLQTLAQVNILLRAKLRSYNNIKTRLHIAINFVKAIRFMHKHKSGPFILCDSCVLKGYLKQFLLTNDLGVILNDLDSLTKLYPNNMTICDCTRGNLQAPEEKIDSVMRITEKRDIWRIPYVTNYILGTNDTYKISSRLQKLHNKCAAVDPWKRPPIERVLQIYEKIQRNI